MNVGDLIRDLVAMWDMKGSSAEVTIVTEAEDGSDAHWEIQDVDLYRGRIVIATRKET